MDKLLNEYYITGSRGYWYFDFEIADNIQIGGGYFTRKSDARRALWNAVLEYIPNKAIAKKYLELLLLS